MRKRGIMKLGICVGVLMCLTFSVPSYAAEVPMVVTGFLIWFPDSVDGTIYL